jgi:hypothetical protein
MKKSTFTTNLVACLSFGAVLAFGCGGSETNVLEFEGYGSGQPGTNLDEGGEILIERIKLNVGAGEVDYSTFHAYQYTSATGAGGRLPAPGVCEQLKAGTVWPTNELPADAEWVDWGADVKFTSDQGLDVTVPKMVSTDLAVPELRDNRPNFNRLHSFIYGGPDWQAGDPAPLAFGNMVNNAKYTVTAGANTFDFYFPPEHTAPLGIGTTATDPVTIPAGTEDWLVEWPVVAQAEGLQHTKSHHFAFLAFAEIDPTYGPIAVGLCAAAEDGSVNVPRSFIDTVLPDGGVIQHGRLTHYMDELDGRRFDLVAIDCTIGLYGKEGAAAAQ